MPQCADGICHMSMEHDPTYRWHMKQCVDAYDTRKKTITHRGDGEEGRKGGNRESDKERKIGKEGRRKEEVMKRR